jgi:hypothetical protein
MRKGLFQPAIPRLRSSLAWVPAATLLLWPSTSLTFAQGPTPGFRTLAPGVLTTIPPGCEQDDTHSRHRIHALFERGGQELEWTPFSLSPNETLAKLAAQTEFRHTVWCLEFSFKPLRMIWVDIPQSNGTMQRSQVWYLVYRVSNRGGHLRPERQANGTYTSQQVDDVGEPIYFVPRFELYSHEYKTCYPDELMPVAVDAIRQREDPNRQLLNSAEISQESMGVSTDVEDRSLWGVATWNGTSTVDPRIDFFSIYVQGLSNAYQWDDVPNALPSDGAATRLRFKTLQLNFWKPGDELDPQEEEIRYGVPPGQSDKYGLTEPQEYRWVFVRACQ